MNAIRSSVADCDVVVIGGGLAGLTAASFVANAGHRVMVLERRGRLGGLATTDVRDGFHFNQGPHALYLGGPAHAALVELGARLPGGPPSKNARLLVDGRIERSPGSPWTLLRSGALGGREKIELGRLFGRLARIDPSEFSAVPVGDWIDGVLRRDGARRIAHALVRLATYVHDPERLSADVAIAQLQRAVRDGVRYLDGGWEPMVRQLASNSLIQIEVGAQVSELPDAPAVIIAGGGPGLAEQLLGRRFELGPSAAASCIDLGLSASPAHDFVLGVDEPVYFSNHSAGADLAPRGHVTASAMRYLRDAEQPPAGGLGDVIEHAGITPEMIVMQRRLHRMTTVSAIPTALDGGLAGRPRVDATGHDHVMIAGDWVGPEGHLLDAVLASARAAAMRTIARLAHRRTVR